MAIGGIALYHIGKAINDAEERRRDRELEDEQRERQRLRDQREAEEYDYEKSIRESPESVARRRAMDERSKVMAIQKSELDLEAELWDAETRLSPKEELANKRAKANSDRELAALRAQELRARLAAQPTPEQTAMQRDMAMNLAQHRLKSEEYKSLNEQRKWEMGQFAEEVGQAAARFSNTGDWSGIAEAYKKIDDGIEVEDVIEEDDGSVTVKFNNGKTRKYASVNKAATHAFWSLTDPETYFSKKGGISESGRSADMQKIRFLQDEVGMTAEQAWEALRQSDPMRIKASLANSLIKSGNYNDEGEVMDAVDKIMRRLDIGGGIEQEELSGDFLGILGESQ